MSSRIAAAWTMKLPYSVRGEEGERVVTQQGVWRERTNQHMNDLYRTPHLEKAISATGREGPYGCETSRLPHNL
jgi:hypothetical protein